ncbi:ABC transporter permease [Microbacterium sp.]|uniref:ABC transporter permease n=1 Tax=Microbacterium sp. TaxID=51671 RepID=UPI002D799E99|nr:ABC transporter permease [Microbacterium sp.]HET6301981.1 ABC transporter permease [Microbacterium sp.]
MIAAIRCEAVKAARSLVGIIALVAYVGGVTALCSVVIALARSGDTQLIAKLGSSVTDDWAGLVSAAAQIAGAGGFVASGVVASWIFAREFADRTISRLFALPVSRGRIAIAKTAVFALWNLAAAVLTLALLLIAGTALGLGAPSPDEWAALVRIPVLVVLTALAVLPVAWVASITGSLLAAIGSAVGLLVVTQVGVLSGSGGWMPFAAPALWAMSGGAAVTIGQLALTGCVGAVALAATVVVWRRLQLDR